MKISLNWLQDFIKLKTNDLNLIQERITNRSAEIEEVIYEGEAFKNIVIGHVLTVEKHPDADKLNITKTNIGEETLQIVCGAKNVKAGLKVAVALIGAELPNGLKIQKTKIRGMESCGMICSEEELEIAEESEGIWELPQDAPLGMKLTEYLGINDVVFDISNTAITNRADLFSHIGFANEFVANDLGEHKKRENLNLLSSQNKLPLEIEFETNDLSPIYSAVSLDKIKIEPSPEWMQKRLRAVGIRPINNIVDITNYVMMEIGMPLHAFDLDKIKGKKIKMRRSLEGEKMTTLDAVKRTLPATVIILEDQEKIFDLCGIMGGANSEISDKTKRILLHAPIYNPILIRKAMLALGHRTEAATMYEKGVPFVRSFEGVQRALELILEILPTSQITSEIWQKSIPQTERIIDLSKQEISRVLDTDVPEKIIHKILTDLGFEVTEKTQEFQVKVPPFRFGDIVGAHDLIEEIVRIYDINLLPEILPIAPLKPAKINTNRELEKSLKEGLCALGFNEVLTYTFIGPDLLLKTGQKKTDHMIEIANPISKDISLMQTSLLPSLLEISEKNIRYQKDFNLFEFANTYHKEVSNQIIEKKYLGGIMLQGTFYKLKGIVESILQKNGHNPRFLSINESFEFMHPGRCADILIGNTKIGYLSEIHPLICQNFNLKKGVMAFEIDCTNLFSLKTKQVIYKALAKFPSINLDISILVDKKMTAEKLIQIIKRSNPLITEINLIDFYEGEQIPKNKKSLTFSITYQSPDRTLTDEDVNSVHQTVIINLEKAEAEIRT